MIVMKFGGTSVADPPAIERLIGIVRAARQAAIQPEVTDWRGPIVVVSALGGVTDRLLGIAAEAVYDVLKRLGFLVYGQVAPEVFVPLRHFRFCGSSELRLKLGHSPCDEFVARVWRYPVQNTCAAVPAASVYAP